MKAENSSEAAPVWKAHRSPDFLLSVLLRAKFPAAKLKEEYRQKGYQIAWTRYPGHNIVAQAELLFNDLKTQSFDNHYLDKWANLFVGGYGKWINYNRQVGNTPEATTFAQALPEFTAKVPLPFSFARSTEDALPLCNLKLVDTKFALHLNNELGRLLRVRRPIRGKNGKDSWEYLSGDMSDYVDFDGKSNKLREVELYGRYAMVTDEEREFHKNEERSVVMEQTMNYDHSSTQTGSGSVLAPFHWTGAVKTIMFGAVNKTAEKYNNHSNYTTDAHNADNGKNPIKTVSLAYDYQHRFQNIPADMFSEVEPMNTFPNANPDTGIHGMSYATKPHGTDPSGATVFDRLMAALQVDIEDKPTIEEGSDRELKMQLPNEYQLVLRGIVETNYVISNGTIRIPVSA